MGIIDVKVHPALRLDLLSTDEDKARKLRPGVLLLARSFGRAAKPLIAVFGDVKVSMREVDNAEDVSKSVHVACLRELAWDARKVVDSFKSGFVDQLEGFDSSSPACRLPWIAGTPKHDQSGPVVHALQLTKVRRKLNSACSELARMPRCVLANSGRG